MKLRNKKTEEIVRVEFLSNWQTDDGTEIGFRECNTNNVYSYGSLAELNEEWEDYEEPKEYYVINPVDWKEVIGKIEYRNDNTDKINREIGNYFETREEAELAVEKLKAWQRLKDKGFRFIEGYLDNNDDFIIKAKLGHVGLIDQPDVHLLFGGEE